MGEATLDQKISRMLNCKYVRTEFEVHMTIRISMGIFYSDKITEIFFQISISRRLYLRP